MGSSGGGSAASCRGTRHDGAHVLSDKVASGLHGRSDGSREAGMADELIKVGVEAGDGFPSLGRESVAQTQKVCKHQRSMERVAADDGGENEVRKDDEDFGRGDELHSALIVLFDKGLDLAGCSVRGGLAGSGFGRGRQEGGSHKRQGVKEGEDGKGKEGDVDRSVDKPVKGKQEVFAVLVGEESIDISLVHRGSAERLVDDHAPRDKSATVSERDELPAGHTKGSESESSPDGGQDD